MIKILLFTPRMGGSGVWSGTHTHRTLGCVVDNSKFYRTKSSYRILLNHYKALVAEMFFTRKNSNSKFV